MQKLTNFTVSKNSVTKNSCVDDLAASPPQLFGRGGDRPHRPSEASSRVDLERERRDVLVADVRQRQLQ